MMMHDVLSLPLAALGDYFKWWQGVGLLVVIGLIVFLKVWRSRQM